MSLRKVYKGKAACENSGQGLAAVGELTGAIWMEVQAPLNTIQVLWAKFNVYGRYLLFVMQ
jgi:hypothetical protein